jgi:hypothetical protein
VLYGTQRTHAGRLQLASARGARMSSFFSHGCATRVAKVWPGQRLGAAGRRGHGRRRVGLPGSSRALHETCTMHEPTSMHCLVLGTTPLRPTDRPAGTIRYTTRCIALALHLGRTVGHTHRPAHIHRWTLEM